MGLVRHFWRRITGRDLVEKSDRDRIRHEQEKKEGKVERLEFEATTRQANATRLEEAGLTGRAEHEEQAATSARREALRATHARVYGDDPLLDLLGGPGDPT